MMQKKTAIDTIVTLMEMSIDPTIGSPGNSMEIGMAIMPGDNDSLSNENEQGFHSEDYIIAKQLVSQVGSVERAHELLDNLDEVLETLNLASDDDEQIEFIAGCCPDEIDFPTNNGSY